MWKKIIRWLAKPEIRYYQKQADLWRKLYYESEEAKERILNMEPGTAPWMAARNAQKSNSGLEPRGPSMTKQEPLRPWIEPESGFLPDHSDSLPYKLGLEG